MIDFDEILFSLMEQQTKAEAEFEKISEAMRALGDLRSEQIARGLGQIDKPAPLIQETK